MMSHIIIKNPLHNLLTKRRNIELMTSLLLIMIGVLAWFTGNLYWIVLSMASFGLLYYRNKSDILKLQYLGIANWITTLRLLTIFTICLGQHSISAGGIVVLITLSPVLDVFDGLVARKRNEVSSFGMIYDLEVDALYVLVTSILIALQDSALLLVLIPAFLRYVYKFFIDLNDPKSEFKESKKVYASVVAGNYFVAVIAYFWLTMEYTRYYILLSSILIICSFCISFKEFMAWRNMR